MNCKVLTEAARPIHQAKEGRQNVRYERQMCSTYMLSHRTGDKREDSASRCSKTNPEQVHYPCVSMIAGYSPSDPTNRSAHESGFPMISDHSDEKESEVSTLEEQIFLTREQRLDTLDP